MPRFGALAPFFGTLLLVTACAGDDGSTTGSGGARSQPVGIGGFGLGASGGAFFASGGWGSASDGVSAGGVSSVGGVASGGVRNEGGQTGSGSAAAGGSRGGADASGGSGSGGASSGGSAAGGAAASGGNAGAWLSADQEVRILPLGDSITAEGSCWRQRLWELLQDAGRTKVDFRGSMTAADCGGGYDADHEGHGGVLVTEVSEASMDDWFRAAQADVVLLHFATNDVWNNVPAAAILAQHLRLVQRLRAVNPSVIILEAQIIPMAPSSCSSCQTSIPELNGLMPAWAAQHSLAESPIFVVDQYSGFDPAVDTTDGVHPYQDSGASKMAQRWFEALEALYR